MPKDKKIAILMLCHIFPNQINDFIDRFSEGHFDFFIHVDKTSEIKSKIHKRDYVYFVPDEKRVDVRWGQYSMVDATLVLINLAMHIDSYDYYWLCSGQDFPIKSTEIIYNYLQERNCNFISIAATRNNPVTGYCNTKFDKRCEVVYPNWIIGRTVLQRGLKKIYNIATGGTGHTFKLFRRKPPYGLKLYFGSQWWCINRETMEWIVRYIIEQPEVCAFYSDTLCPDESFFHTLVMNSLYSKNIEPNLVYIDWSGKNSSPKVLTELDFDAIMCSDKMIARKIDSTIAPELYFRLQDSIGKSTANSCASTFSPNQLCDSCLKL